MTGTSRRQFLFLTAATASAATFRGPAAWAMGDMGPTGIDVVTRTIEVKGKAATVYGLIGPGGKHGATFTAGESFYVRETNKLREPTLIHWHGLTPPSHQDGVPVLSADPIQPGASQLYDFRLTEPGTYWMHTHFSLSQMQKLLSAPLIVRDPAERHLDEQEVVVMLNDFTFRDADEILAGLRKEGSTEKKAGEEKKGAPETGAAAMAGMAGMAAKAGMAEMPGMAGNTPAPMAGMPGMTGNAPAPMANMPGMSGTPSAPMGGMPGMGGTPPAPMAGMPGMSGGAPAPMPNMPGMSGTPSAPMAGMPGMGGTPPAPMAGMPGMSGSAPAPMPNMPGTPGTPSEPAAMPGMGGMAGMKMDMNDVDFDAYLANDRTLADPEVVAVEKGGTVRLRIISGAASTNFFVDLGQLDGELIAVDGQAIMPVKGKMFPIAMAQRLDIRVRVPADGGAFPIFAQREDDMVRTGIVLATKSAQVQKVSDQASAKAGTVGLEFEARLRPRQPLALRPADRTHQVVLGGNMASYVWTMNGAVYGQDKPLQVSVGERVELVMHNQTGMSHPMHLHGTIYQVVAIDGKRINGARRDTVIVPPNRSVTIAFDADNAGRWAYHCHNSYHQEAGMMTSVEYV